MRPVSAAFQKAVRQPVRQDRIEGFIGLWDSETVFHSWPFNETQIVQGSLSITDQLTGGKFGFGGAYIRNLSIKLDLTKFHENFNRTLINLTDGEIMLFYYLTLEDGTEERVYLGQFFIDSEKSSRKFNVLSITAVDGLSKFDTPANSHSDETLYGAYCYACHGTNGNKTTITNTPQFFESLPNGTMSLTYDNSQIQTNRDLLMWLGELTGTFVRECRDDPPDWEASPLFNSPTGRPELVQIPIKYTKANTSGNFDLEAFKADNGSIIPADVRFSTEFSDTSIRVTTWNTNYKGKTLTAHASWTIEPDTLEGTMELNSNPLLDSKSENDVRIALNKILDYGEELRFCPFKITFNGNPAIECGDFVYLEPGGSIDETQYRHYGIVTYYKWRFHGKSEIRCSTDAAASYTRPKETEESTQSVSRIGVKKAAARTATPSESTKAKSQLEKRVDALEGKAGASDRLVLPTGQVLRLVNGNISGIGAPAGEILLGVTDKGYITVATSTMYVKADPYSIKIKGVENSQRIGAEIFMTSILAGLKVSSDNSNFPDFYIENYRSSTYDNGNLSLYWGNQSFRLALDDNGVRRAFVNGHELAFKDEI